MAAGQKVGERLFTYQDQVDFATLTGDRNPIHMDRVTARRSVVGDVVVHGMHTVLCALESFCRKVPQNGRLAKLDARFPKPVYLGETVEVLSSQQKDGSYRLTLQVGEKKTAKIRLWWGPLEEADTPDTPLTETVALSDPEDATMPTEKGRVPYTAPVGRFADAFPAASGRIGAGVLRDIAATSTLVGMQCPGLRSLYSRLTLEWTAAGSAAPLEYAVSDVDARYGLLTIAVQGRNVHGEIEAFHLPRPVRQLTIEEVAARVASDRFVGETALIVGGSRGLGELTAKIVAAGGGHAIVTYAVGRKDADLIAEEIRAWGGKIDVIPYDVTAPADAQLAGLTDLPAPTQLFYFATCRIAHDSGRAFDLCQLEKFNRFYTDGFWNLAEALHQRGVSNLSCFYPSTVFVETCPAGLTEYAIAKSSGELLARNLCRLLPGYRAICPRLPRLMTDQNSSISDQDFPEVIDVLLPLLEGMQNTANG